MSIGIKLGRAAKSKRVQARLKKKADAAAEYWKSVSPVFGDLPPKRDAPPGATNAGGAGSYRDSITAKQIPGKDGGIAYRVGPKDPKARWIEDGTKHMPKYAPKAKVLARFK